MKIRISVYVCEVKEKKCVWALLVYACGTGRGLLVNIRNMRIPAADAKTTVATASTFVVVLSESLVDFCTSSSC